MADPNILVIPGSSRAGSWNAKLATVITGELARMGAIASRISLADYEMPLYNGDLEKERGIPANTRKLARMMSEQHGVVLVCPEYNSSVTPLLKNTIDWLSRDLGDLSPFSQRSFALASCSPGNLGGLRGLSHMRDILVSVGADVVTPQLSVNQAGGAFDNNDGLTQERHQALLKKLCGAILERARVNARG